MASGDRARGARSRAPPTLAQVSASGYAAGMSERYDTWGLAPREACARARDGAIEGGALLRALLTWPLWIVPGTSRWRVPVMRTPDGARILELFSDPEALAAFEAAEPTADLPEVGDLRLEGWRLFRALGDEELARVSVDTHSPHACSYQGDDIAELRRWAAIVELEAALRSPDDVADAVGVLASFGSYLVVVRGHAPHEEVVMAPDEERELAAVFTAPDAAEQFMESAIDALGPELRAISYAAPDLFAALDRMDLDGVVFNPVTHLPPRAFQPALIRRLRERCESTAT